MKTNEHQHHHNNETRESLIKILLSSVLLIAAVWLEHTHSFATWQLLLLYLLPYLIVGAETLKEAAEGLLHGEALNEDFLMSVATIGALSIGFMPGAEHQFPEAVFVMLFFQVGELLEGIAEGKSRKSIAHLMDIRPDVAHVLVGETEHDTAPEQVAVGSTIVVRPGEKIPLDGFVTLGHSSLNTIALTGESLPREVQVEDEVTSGCINLSGLLHIRTTKSFGESTVSKIINLVENAAESKSKSESFISRFARVYTPIVVLAAVVLALLPPLLSGHFAATFPLWLERALCFLVVSCPCALVISVPLAFFGGIGGASRSGILIKGSNFIDALAQVDTMVFDKTGTLTKGNFSVESLHPEQCDPNHLLHLAAHVERHSSHPIAVALRDAYPNEDDDCLISDVQELAGMGICARVNNQLVHVGNAKMMDHIGLQALPCDIPGTIIHVAIEGRYAGHIVISDQPKAESANALQRLRQLGVRRTVMLTGDRSAVADHVARQLGIDQWHADLLPHQKVEEVERLLNEQPPQGRLAFVGDGINDAPVLARADIGIAMGGLGSDAAIEAADVVLMDDNPAKIATAIAIARRTLRIARQNTLFAIGVKLAVLLLASLGWANMWMAVFADVGVTFLAVLNAGRSLKAVKE